MFDFLLPCRFIGACLPSAAAAIRACRFPQAERHAAERHFAAAPPPPPCYADAAASRYGRR